MEQTIFIRPDPLHSWYASFIVCQTLRMWISAFEKCQDTFDRVLALRSLVYFQQPAKKKQLPDNKDYTKQHAFYDILMEKKKQGEDIKLEAFYKKRLQKKLDDPKKKLDDPKKKQDYLNLREPWKDLVIPKEFDEEAKRKMMANHKNIKREKIKQDIIPDIGPIDVFDDGMHEDFL